MMVRAMEKNTAREGNRTCWDRVAILSRVVNYTLSKKLYLGEGLKDVEKSAM